VTIEVSAESLDEDTCHLEPVTMADNATYGCNSFEGTTLSHGDASDDISSYGEKESVLLHVVVKDTGIGLSEEEQVCVCVCVCVCVR
jgi:signal transduction histidine kinase